MRWPAPRSSRARTNCLAAEATAYLVAGSAETLPSASNPLGYLKTAVSRNEGRRHFEEQVVEIIACLTADLGSYRESPPSREQPDCRAGALGWIVLVIRVVTMHHTVQIRRLQPRTPKHAGDSGYDGRAGVVRRGQAVFRRGRGHWPDRSRAQKDTVKVPPTSTPMRAVGTFAAILTPVRNRAWRQRPRCSRCEHPISPLPGCAISDTRSRRHQRIASVMRRPGSTDVRDFGCGLTPSSSVITGRRAVA